MIFILVVTMFFLCVTSDANAAQKNPGHENSQNSLSITIPDQDALNTIFSKYFDDYGFQSFTEQTQIGCSLAGKTLKADEMMQHLFNAINRYLDFLKNPFYADEVQQLYQRVHGVLDHKPELQSEFEHDSVACICAIASTLLSECINEVLTAQPEAQKDFNRLLDKLAG